jgi:Tfp pilus assembly major pilin PilA
MRVKQLGISLGGLMVGAAIFVVLAMIGMKLGPSYLEFASIKKAVVAIAQEKPGATVIEVRKAFDARATIDAISSIEGKDLDVTKDGGELVITAAYRKEIPLFANIGVHIDFRAVSKE